MKKIEFENLPVGEQFVYQGNQYTKLDDNGLSILDSWHERLSCCFDCYNNNYKLSIARCYLKNNVFKDILKIKAKDVLNNVNVFNDKIFLLSIEEYKRYREHIKNYNCFWWLRSPHGCYAGGDSYAWYVSDDGGADGSYVSDTYPGLRAALIFKSEIMIDVE